MIQGLTEFLPVSSSGHLVLGGHALGLEEPHLFFDVVVHCGTLLAVLFFYRTAINTMWRETCAGIAALWKGRSLSTVLASYPEFKLFSLIVIGSVPTALIGLGFKDTFEALFTSPRLVAGMLLITASLLLVTRARRPSTPTRGIDAMTVLDVILIGTIQGLAITPGISRSGSTIALGLLLGLDRELAARYSFLLSIPAIVGALMLQVAEGAAVHSVVPAQSLAIGFVTAFAFGMLALSMLVPLVRSGRFYLFALYLIPVGIWGLTHLPQ